LIIHSLTLSYRRTLREAPALHFEHGETTTSSPDDGVPSDEYVAVCLAIRDQHLDIAESMLHHYHHHGIRRFYIMDDGSNPPLSTFEYPGIPRSALTFTYQDRETRVLEQQIQAYKWCIERYREKHKWIAFFDGDEFLETPGKETFREILESFDGDDKVGGLAINWKVHTSSGILTRPPSARKAFNECVTDGTDDDGLIGLQQINTHIKTVAKTSLVSAPMGPHRVYLNNGAETVGETGDIITTLGFRKPITRNRIALHHYAIKSMEEFQEKLHRGNGMSDDQSRGAWEYVEFNMTKVPCNEMVNYNP
jgi:hypothetical protein